MAFGKKYFISCTKSIPGLDQLTVHEVQSLCVSGVHTEEKRATFWLWRHCKEKPWVGHWILTEREEGCGSKGDVDTSENTSSCPGLIQAFLGGGTKEKEKENHSDLKCWDLTATTASLVLCPQEVTCRGGEASICHLTGALLSLEPSSQVTTGGDNRPVHKQRGSRAWHCCHSFKLRSVLLEPQTQHGSGNDQNLNFFYYFNLYIFHIDVLVFNHLSYMLPEHITFS